MNAIPDAAEWAEIRRTSREALPAWLDPEAPAGVLLPYQVEMLEAFDDHQLVATDKSRRVGATWGIGALAVLTSGARRADGGMDTLYLGYNLDMAREFVDTCAMWARAFNQAASAIDEFLFEEDGEAGERKAIKAFRITFASGFEIVALSSKPRSLRGRQGFVILDEFAFHDAAAELLKAAIALLIWGGKLLVISTHNGVDNPFNELLTEIRSGQRPGKVVRVTFDDAIEQGLYERICLVTGKEWSPEGEAEWRARIRAMYRDAAAEELDCIPTQGSGVYLSSALIEANMEPGIPVLRLRFPDGFATWEDGRRTGWVRDWISEHLDPVLATLPKNLQHVYGFDFARSGDLSAFVPLTLLSDLRRRTPFVLEMRNAPFSSQQQILFHVVERLPRFVAGKHDARGNGQSLAEAAQQRFGFSRVEAVMLSQAWYLENSPKLKTRLEDRTLILPMDADIRDDLRQLTMVRGIAKVPDDAKTTGADGGQRHGDVAIAAVLAVAASEADPVEYAYRPAPPPARRDPFGGSARGDWMRASEDRAPVTTGRGKFL